MRIRPCLHVTAALVSGTTLAAQAPEFHSAATVPGIASQLVFDSTRGRTIAVERGSDWRLWEWNGTRWAQLGGMPPSGQSPSSLPFSAVFDPLRGVVMVLQGNRIDAWDGARWITHQTNRYAGGPCVYDSGRNRIVVRNGPNEVLEWDGAQWLTIRATGPSTRSYEAFAYDPSGGRCLLYGGFGNSPLADFWSWNGAAWTQLAANAPPGPRVSASLAHEPSTGRMILFGGEYNDSTWQLQGNTWTKVSTGVAPGERQRAALVWDGTGLLLHGGDVHGGETWRFANNAWQELDAGAPTGSYEALVCWDPVRDEGVWLGPDNNHPVHPRETWTFDGRWHRRHPTLAPSIGYGLGRRLAFSTVEGEALLFSGSNDTWSWTGATWRRRTPATSPPQRLGSVMVTDPSTGVMLFGGKVIRSTFTYLDDQWHWNGTTWKQQNPSVRPAPRADALAVLDPWRNVVVVAGGHSSTAAFTETWEWDGVFWVQRAAIPFTLFVHDRISFRYETGRVFVEAQNRFEWDGVTWTPVGSGTLPNSAFPTLLTDPPRGRLLAIGGEEDTAVFTTQPASASRYGNGCAIGTAPALMTIGRPEPGQAGFEIAATTYAGMAPTLIAFGLSAANQPLGSGCSALIGNAAAVRLLTSSPLGEARIALPLPPAPGLVGFTFFVQAAVVDPLRGLFGGLTLSDGLAVTIGY